MISEGANEAFNLNFVHLKTKVQLVNSKNRNKLNAFLHQAQEPSILPVTLNYVRSGLM